jgi:hypothetical protein
MILHVNGYFATKQYDSLEAIILEPSESKER